MAQTTQNASFGPVIVVSATYVVYLKVYNLYTQYKSSLVQKK